MPHHILLVLMGAPGGIGRFEQHLIRAFSVLSQRHVLRITVLQLAPRAAGSSVRLIPVNSAHGCKARLATTFSAALLRRRPDFVIFGHVNLARLVLPWLLFRRPLKYAVAGYGIDVWYPLSWARRTALCQASTVLAISGYTAERLVHVHHVKPGRIHLLPCAYGLDTDELRPPARPLPGPPHLLSVTRLDEPEKGVDAVIRALPRLLQRYPDLRYEVIGRGRDLERLRRLAVDLGVAPYVCFRGFVPDDELRDAYAACDVFVLPSGKEGFGIVYLEAMAQSKPVVAANAGGVPDVVIDGQTGLLVPFGDVEAVADAVLTLLDDEALRLRLGAAGRSRLEHEFSFEQFTARLECALEPS